ncbi:LOW QUALITY PROTEIN: snake venom metalloproteinase acutolysin-C-like [Dreissena polymorpha]|uniref:LOW QUALITY PROTEIN: snake venom metalloproteinase acutolysin-C-like n=1 Tax=Dreissena polymorpha TaxID=45954 RepID=UPI0022641D75|nr:LOW QUALITY PROTEIN: snake venom metalloproteinase acutolysin-C-like [Dreissena polymorpha]
MFLIFNEANKYGPRSGSPSTEGQRQRRSPANHKVEFLPVVDYPIYSFWFNRSTGNATTDAAKKLDAIENIREFYAFVMNAIDIRYQKIVSTAISIDIVFAGIFIADAPTISTWTESNKSTATPRDKVDALTALKAFKDWLAQTTEGYDHAMAFTGYDLAMNGSTSNAGLAWTPGTCKHISKLANSISEDHFESSLAIIAAHELGHNLGSKHDGDGNNCLEDDKYVMSPSSGGVIDQRALNHWLFSTCSVSQIEAYILELDRYKY